MRKVFTIGETVYDIIFSDGALQAGKPGGSMLNTSVSLGRLGVDVHFISEAGNDDLGELITGFLRTNHVGTQYFHRFDEGRTPLALAFLDADKNARYTFYKDYPPQRLRQRFPEVSANDIVLFGSFFSISPEIREKVKTFVEYAEKQGALIIYDPNIRKPHQKQIPGLLSMIRENLSLAHIVRASHEDFQVIFNVKTAREAFALTAEAGDAALIYTRSEKPVEVISKHFTGHYRVPVTKVKSTIGAGDNFNAGLIFSLLRQNIHASDLPGLTAIQWEKLIRTGIALSREVCKGFDNYISKEFADNFLNSV